MDKVWQLKQFIQYRLNAGGARKLHSPFMFDLYQEVIKDAGEYYAYNQIERVRRDLLEDRTELKFNDLGAKANGNSFGRKKVSSIAKSALSTPRQAQLLFRLVNYFQPEVIVEIGTSLGISTAYMACGRKSAQIHTIEGCGEILKIANSTLQRLGIKRVYMHHGNFDDVLPPLVSKLDSLCFAYVDGNHTYEATVKYFDILCSKANHNSVFVIDDIYWSEEMTKAWNVIKSDQRVTVSVDLFYMGLVFFRSGQVKENFVLNY